MSKIFEFDARKGSYIDQVSKVAGTNANGEFKVTEKGKAWKGNGTNSYIYFDKQFNESELTITAIFKLNKSTSIDQIIFDNRDSASDGIRLVYVDISQHLSAEINGTLTSLGVVSFNKWYICIITLNSTESNFYLGDENNPIVLKITNIGATLNITNNLYISGRSFSTSSYNIDGFINHLFANNTIFTSQERDKAYEEFLHSYNLSKPKTGFVTHKATDLSNEVENTLGDEEVTNGGFDTDTYWTKNTGVTISGGTANFDNTVVNGTGLVQVWTSLIGKRIKITYEITSYTSGTLKLYDNSWSSLAGNAVGVYSEEITVVGNQLRLYALSSFVGSVDNVTVQELTGLVAAYNMIPSNGKLVDISGEGNTGTITGAISTKDGMKFDGISNNITKTSMVHDFDNASEVSFLMRFKILGNTGTDYILSMPETAGANNGIDINTDGTYIQWSLATHSDSSILDIRYTYTNNVIYSLGYSYDGVTLNGYINGNLIGSHAVTLGTGIKNAAKLLCLGTFSAGAANSNVEIQDARIYNRSFTPQQAKDYHNSFVKVVTLDDFSTDPVGESNPEGWQ